LAWAKDGSLIAGETNRGWGSAGEATEGLQRLVWNNKVPFEMRAIRAMPDGFEIEFTKPVDKKTAEDIASYSIESYIYKYHAVYGSPPVDTKKCPIAGVKVSADGMKVRLIVKNLRQHYIHTINLPGVQDKENYFSLVHPIAWYTLNNIPDGPKLAMTGVSTKNSGKVPVVKGNAAIAKTASPAPSAATGASYAAVRSILQKNTCLACHHPTKRLVGPAYVDVAKRKYSVATIMALIRKPKPENWPDHATPMPPMPQVSNADAKKIAEYIKSLETVK